MTVHKYLNVFFSPFGGTQKNAELLRDFICQSIACCGLESDTKKVELLPETLDLLRNPLLEEKTEEADCLTLVSVPVYAGRVPAAAASQLRRLKGQNTPAIAAVIYGNRDYDDALLELTDLLTENGFTVIGAAALLAEHSIFPEIAAGRPDEKDKEEIAFFANQCLEELKILPQSVGDKNGTVCPLTVKGNRPYKKPAGVPVKPRVSKKCNNCGICAALCPVAAIDKSDCRKFGKDICISCAACIKNCPIHARSFGGPVYAVGAAGFKKKCAERREAEFFYRSLN